MENAYGIGITNRYSCFLDNEDDPVEALKANEVDKEAKKKETGSGNATTTGPRKGIRDSNKGGNEANKQNNKITNNGVAGRPARGPRPTGQDPKNVKFNNEEDREDRNNRRNRDDAPREQRPDGEFNRGPRRPGQFKPRGGAPGSGRPRGPPGAPGTGGERGSGGGGGGERGGMRKREFDRQSGSDKSGVKPVDKRDGAGSRNWGTYKDDLEEASTAAPADETMDEKNDSAEITETGDAGEVKSEEQNENQEPEDPAQKFMTLDEWKAMQQPKAKPVYNLRKAGEGEDQSQWKKMILKKKEEQEEEGEEEEYEEDYDCPQRAGRQKQILDIDFHFADSRRGGTGGRGGRGGRGGAGRGGDRGPRPPRPAGDRERRERDPDRERGAERGGERGERAPPAPGAGNNGNGSGSGRGEQTNAGGFRNRNNRFGNRYETPRSQTAPKVDDVNDFPSLG